MTDPHWHLRQHLQDEICRLEESENIEPEERDRRIQCLRGQLQHIDDIGRHHQEMLTRMREHEKERQARFERERQEQTHQNSRTVVRRELERRKRAYKENRAENGREMRKWLDTQKKLHEGRKDKEGRKYTSWIDAWKSVIRLQHEHGNRRWKSDVRLKIVCALALLYVGILVRNGWRAVKSFVAHKKAAVAYEDKYGNMHPCAFCGQMESATHSVYHSVFRRTDGGPGEYYIDRCGLVVYACDRCLKIHRVRHLIFSVLKNLFIAMLVSAVGFWCLEGCVLIAAAALQMDCPFLMLLNGAISAVCVCIIFALYMLHRLTDFFHPWKRLVGRHPVVLELLKSGYKLDDDWPRLVGEGLDTDRRSRTISRGKAGMEHETYCWMGALPNFGFDGMSDPKAEEALRFMRAAEKGRVAPRRAKIITSEQAVVGVIFLIYIAIVIVMLKLLMK